MKPKNPTDDVEDDEDEELDASLEDRTKDYSKYKYIQKQLWEIYAKVDQALANKKDQNDTINENWDIYHCILNENQSYSGTAEVYLPIVRDAMAARETRFINTLFPGTGRYCEIVGNDGKQPYDLMALMDYYVRTTNLRTIIVPGMIRTGDISGNYALYVEWQERTRHITSKVKVPEMETELGTPVEGSPEYDDMAYEEVTEGMPVVTVVDPRNLVVLPAAGINSIEEAEIVSITMRYTKEMIKKKVKEGVFEEDAADVVLANMSTATSKKIPDTGKDAAEAAGVKIDSAGNKSAQILQVWCRLKIKSERRWMVVHFGGPDIILGCKRNPYWCDRIPVMLQAVEKNPDTVWGDSPIDPGVRMLQYQANDIVNEGMDSAQYALCPIVMTDPNKNPRAGSMVLAMASVWLCDPNSTRFAEFPKLWQDAFTIVDACKNQIFQSLGVNPAMMPHGNAGKKPTQAQIAQEQQVALESTADNITLIQEGILGKLLEWFYELDYQYRTEAITVRKFGELGLQATMDQVEPFQVRERYEFRWYGTEGFKAAQQVQQQIAWMGTITKIPPQMLNGRKVDVGPMVEAINATILGPRVAPHVLVDQRHQLSMSPEMENRLLAHEFPVQTHEMDNDQEHIQSHFQHFEMLLKEAPDIQEASNIARLVKGHILTHIQQMKTKAAMAMQGQQQMLPPAGGRAGAQIEGPTGPQNPAGAVHPDNMALAMPRRA